MSSIFTKILNQEIPGEIIYQDQLVFAIKDISPAAKHHYLIIPKKEISTINDITTNDEATLGRLFTVAQHIAKQLKIDQSGYRLIVNTNSDAGQLVFHIHMHLLGGEKLAPLNPK